MFDTINMEYSMMKKKIKTTMYKFKEYLNKHQNKLKNKIADSTSNVCVSIYISKI